MLSRNTSKIIQHATTVAKTPLTTKLAGWQFQVRNASSIFMEPEFLFYASLLSSAGVFSSLRIIREGFVGERQFLGKRTATLKPGLSLKFPILHQITDVNMRQQIAQIPKQSLISADNVTFSVDALVQYQIVNSAKALYNVENCYEATVEKCQMELRDLLSSYEINSILHNRDELSNKVVASLKHLENDWGMSVKNVQLKDISFDESMTRAMAVKAEADRNAEAKIINATADVATAKQYAEAAKLYQENPLSLRLREFQLWNSVSKSPNNTIYVVPSNLLDVARQTLPAIIDSNQGKKDVKTDVQGSKPLTSPPKTNPVRREACTIKISPKKRQGRYTDHLL